MPQNQRTGADLLKQEAPYSEPPASSLVKITSIQLLNVSTIGRFHLACDFKLTYVMATPKALVWP